MQQVIQIGLESGGREEQEDRLIAVIITPGRSHISQANRIVPFLSGNAPNVVGDIFGQDMKCRHVHVGEQGQRYAHSRNSLRLDRQTLSHRRSSSCRSRGIRRCCCCTLSLAGRLTRGGSRRRRCTALVAPHHGADGTPAGTPDELVDALAVDAGYAEHRRHDGGRTGIVQAAGGNEGQVDLGIGAAAGGLGLGTVQGRQSREGRVDGLLQRRVEVGVVGVARRKHLGPNGGGGGGRSIVAVSAEPPG